MYTCYNIKKLYLNLWTGDSSILHTIDHYLEPLRTILFWILHFKIWLLKLSFRTAPCLFAIFLCRIKVSYASPFCKVGEQEQNGTKQPNETRQKPTTTELWFNIRMNAANMCTIHIWRQSNRIYYVSIGRMNRKWLTLIP